MSLTRLVISFIFCLCSLITSSQVVPKPVVIKGSGISIQLPDTSFIFLEKEKEGPQYVSNRFGAIIGLNTEMGSDPRSFEQLVELWKMEMSRPGSKVEKDSTLIIHGIRARIFKIRMIHEKTGQVQGFWWQSIYNFNGKPLSLMGGYEPEHDAVLSAAYMQSFLSLKAENTDSINAIFKHRFSITTDLIPLKFAGYFLDGYILSINGRGPNSMQETHCVVVPYNNLLLTDDDVINELHVKRLLIHDTKGERVDKAFAAGTKTNSDNTVRYFYDAVEVKDKKKIIFLGIVADKYGYFEIWGEAYGDNRKEFISLFIKIADSIKRDWE